MSKKNNNANNNSGNAKGNSGNTNGGTETSFQNTPQAKDDTISNVDFGALDYNSLVFSLDILANDLGGNSKSLWSVDDGINNSGAMDGYVAGDLLEQDNFGGGESSSSGAMLSVTADGLIQYDASGIESDVAELALGEVLTDNFIYAIRMASGTLSWAGAAFSITGINDAPTLAAGALITDEDNTSSALDLSELGDDVDSDDDGDSLTYSITSGPTSGAASITGTNFVFDPSGDFESLAVGNTATVAVGVRATDTHGATADSIVTVTISGVNDAPTLESGSLAAEEDGDQVSLELAALGDDVDSDDDGTTLDYTLLNNAPGGAASINGTQLNFDPSSDFQSLAQGEVENFDLNVEATDEHGASAMNTVSVTVTGVNDAPTLAAGSVDATEDGSQVSVDLSALGDDVDSNDDGSSLTYDLLNAAASGSAAISGTTLEFNPGSDFQSLAKDETEILSLDVQATDSLGATANNAIEVTVTGVNDTPTLSDSSLGAIEDGVQVSIDLSTLGDDIDSDDDGSSLNYALLNSAPAGAAAINGTSLDFATGSDFQSLAKDETQDFTLNVQATDSHGASTSNNIDVSVVGVNDAPTLAGANLSAEEDGAQISIDLSTLGADVDSDDDANSLNYSLVDSAPAGSTSVSGSTLSFDPSSDFQSLGKDETSTFDLTIKATDTHLATAENTVSITVTGVNDAPNLDGGDTSGAVTLVPGQSPFVVEQWTGYTGSFARASLVTEAASRAADYTTTTNIIDFTDDPNGFAGALPGSSPWPAAVANGVSGTSNILNNTFFARITANILITETDTYTFRTFNDDGVYLTVNNQLIINDPTEHGETEFTGNIDLEPGIYPLELYFFENGGEASLELSFSDSAGVFQHVDTSDATATGNLQFSDVDLSDGHTVSVAAVGSALGSMTAAVTADTTGSGTGGVVGWEFQIDNGAYQELGAGESTTESFVVTVDDGNGGTAQETVTVTINGANDAPEATADAATTDEDNAVTINVLANDTDPDANDTQTLASAANGVNGAVEIINNELVYTPNANFNGDDSFSYTMEDSSGITSTATVNVTVNPIADPAQLGSAEVGLTETDAQQTIAGVLTISDPDEGEEAFDPQSGSAGTYGSFSIDANGSWSYTTDGALDFLAEGQEVSDSFTVSSIDGTETSVTVNILGTADGPTAVADTGELTASSIANTASDNTVYWVDWTSATLVSQEPGRDAVYDVSGTISLPGKTIDVTYSGQSTFQVLSGGTDFYISRTPTSVDTSGAGVFTSEEVGNRPTNNDIIALNHSDSARTLSFSEPIENLFFAIVSMNRNGYLLDQNFSVVSSADSVNDSGFFGYTDGYNITDEGNGQFGISTAGFARSEFHGVLAIDNAVESLTWTGQADENWNGFTIGTYGVAASATTSGNVIDNDDLGGNPPLEVVDVNGSIMAGNSVTLNLASGAILKVDRDGDYLYDDNNAFGALAAGQTSIDTVTYTIQDTAGYSDSATLSITVTGINDAPVAGDDAGSTDEDVAATFTIASLLNNDTDVDNGDTKSLQSVQDAVNGSVSISGSNVVFTPSPHFNGDASFTYTMQDAAGATSTATVNVTVAPVADIYAPQNLITNGSFEGSLNGWSSTQINYIADWQAADGSALLDMNAESGGGNVSQTFATVPGQTYTVGFALSKNPGSPTGSETLRVSADGQAQNYTYSEANSTTDMMWSEQSFTFTADDSSATLQLAGTDPNTVSIGIFGQIASNDAWGPAIDEVVVLSNEQISNFELGASGDILQLTQLLASISAPNDSSAFSGGFLRFNPVGGNTVVQIDPDGGADGYLDAITLVGVNLTVTDTDNYIL